MLYFFENFFTFLFFQYNTNEVKQVEKMRWKLYLKWHKKDGKERELEVS